MGTEFIDHASGQRRLGANDRQAYLFLLRPLAQRAYVGDGNVVEVAGQGRAAVARRHEDARDLGRLAELPGDGMFAAAAADDEYFHWGVFI